MHRAGPLPSMRDGAAPAPAKRAPSFINDLLTRMAFELSQHQPTMRRALLLLPRLQPCSPALVRAFASSASQTSHATDAQDDAAEDHSREGMVSCCCVKQHPPMAQCVCLFCMVLARLSLALAPTSAGRSPTLSRLWKRT